jgi:hypothetical protein
MARTRLAPFAALLLSGTLLTLHASPASAQDASGQPPVSSGNLPNGKVGGSANMHLIAHVPLGGFFRVADGDIEQELSRPYAYIAQTRDRIGFTILNLKDLNNVKVLYRWKIENTALHQGLGTLRPKYFKLNGRYYVALCSQFSQGTPDADLGAIIFDVTSLPDTTKIKEVTRIRFPQMPGGFHNLFPYKHSDGRVLLFTTTTGAQANVYDLAKTLAGDKDQGLIGTIPVPQGNVRAEAFPGFGLVKATGYHDFYIGYDPATRQDMFYGPGGGGYYVFDVTNIGKEEPKLLTSIQGPAGVAAGHTFTPTPDGKYAVTETEYQWAPLRIFDLQPGLEGKVQAITQPVSVWNWDWNDLAHNHEVRWPYVFVSGYEDGIEVFNMQDPAHPRTVAWYYTCECSHKTGFGGLPNWDGQSIYNGAFGIMVRNTDGLILITDMNTGAWFFKLDGFNGWNGADWAMPNISSAQDWDHGPDGSHAPAPPPAPKRVAVQ